MNEKKGHLPVFGIGPFYVITCLVLTLIGLGLNYHGYLKAGYLPGFRIIMMIIGIIFIVCGIILWIYAVVVQKITVEIKKGKLITTGVYGLVRNPIYSAFFLIFTGLLFMASNWILLILPILYWIFLTILLKNTEEKWLVKAFGKKYEDYCKKVNRVIPWVRK